MPVKFPTGQQLEQFAPNVGYEVWMVERSVEEWQKSKQTHTDEFLKNLYIECCLLHARSLQDFFCKTKRTKRDILAIDYFPSARIWEEVQQNQILPNMPYLEANREKINTYLAHLSWDREEMGKQAWCGQKIWDEIKFACETFLRALPEERHQWFFKSTKLQAPNTDAGLLPSSTFFADTSTSFTVNTSIIIPRGGGE